MTLPTSLQDRISALTKPLRQCASKLQGLDAAEDEDFESVRDGEFLNIFRDTCSLVHKSESENSPYQLELVEAAQKLLDEAIEIAYGDENMFDFMPSWAHDDQGGRPLIEGRHEVILPTPHDLAPKLICPLRLSSDEAQKAMDDMLPKAWDESTKRHPKSTRLSRFRPELLALTPTGANSLAMSVYDARCEITSLGTLPPVKLQLSERATCLALLGVDGSAKCSGLECYFLEKGDNGTTGFLENSSVKPGLSGIAYYMTMDESRGLVFVGDNNRVKSYAWEAPDTISKGKLFPVHTLDSNTFSGPMATLSNGTIARAGRGGATLWGIPELQTHGRAGDEIIGREKDIDAMDSWRSDPEFIEPSAGSLPTSHIKFVDQPGLRPAVWHPLIGRSSSVLCVEDARESGNGCCAAIDLVGGGKTVARYLGHSGVVFDFSQSVTDPQVFLTSCGDGYVRLFDVRQSLPVLTIDACGQDESCKSAVLGHPDAVFTGTSKYGVIKVWDVRARTRVYELATGNNAVKSLAWDAQRNCLYAATKWHHRKY